MDDSQLAQDAAQHTMMADETNNEAFIDRLFAASQAFHQAFRVGVVSAFESLCFTHDLARAFEKRCGDSEDSDNGVDVARELASRITFDSDLELSDEEKENIRGDFEDQINAMGANNFKWALEYNLKIEITDAEGIAEASGGSIDLSEGNPMGSFSHDDMTIRLNYLIFDDESVAAIPWYEHTPISTAPWKTYHFIAHEFGHMHHYVNFSAHYQGTLYYTRENYAISYANSYRSSMNDPTRSHRIGWGMLEFPVVMVRTWILGMYKLLNLFP
jgi:hypothetical protein